MRITRQRRAELARQAARIRSDAQRGGAPVSSIAEEITQRLPAITALEAWRLSYGWSRPEVVEGIAALYVHDGLAPPGVTTAMLCRWEHGAAHPSPEYGQALARLYRTPTWRLGLRFSPAIAVPWYRRPTAETGQGTTVEHSSLRAVADSVALHLETEGPSGGPQTDELLEQAMTYYAAHYGDHPPVVLAAEIHRCRSLVVGALRAGPNEAEQRELRRIAGWLSALLGNLAFHTGDTSGAHIHLGASARLGVDVGEHHLAGWSLGAQSMVAFFEGRDRQALELAEQAGEYADTELRSAQIAAWCRLRPLARLGEHAEAERTAATAQRHMDATGHGEQGRFGFDTAELHLHLAESHLDLADPSRAAHHAEASIALKTTGSGGWAAASTVLSRSHVARHGADDACALAFTVLDEVPAQSLRSTTRTRLDTLLADLESQRVPGRQVRDLRDRLAVLPAPAAPSHSSPEPNGH